MRKYLLCFSYELFDHLKSELGTSLEYAHIKQSLFTSWRIRLSIIHRIILWEMFEAASLFSFIGTTCNRVARTSVSESWMKGRVTFGPRGIFYKYEQSYIFLVLKYTTMKSSSAVCKSTNNYSVSTKVDILYRAVLD